MNYKEEYQKWLNKADDKTKQELLSISNDEKEIESRFFSMLEFGTAGLRGIIGAGLNRMNIYTVGYATQGLANLIISQGEEAKRRGVAIAFDSRIMSKEFAHHAACVLAANSISVYLFDELRPTPELSFAVRELKCIAGINITASHNPAKYNGYKVYWEDGAQLPPDHAAVVSDEISKLDIFDDVKTVQFDKAIRNNNITIIGHEIDEKYLSNVLAQTINKDIVEEMADTFKIVYTPFHGAGYRLVPKALKRLGMKHIITVESQMILDGHFPTVKSPNPEDKDGFKEAIALAKANNVALIIGTDPDADRVGIIVRNTEGEYVTLSGNQVGVLLLDYIITSKINNNSLPKNAAVVKTIVTTEMAAKVAKDNNITIFNVLTGFKFIGEKIKEWETSGEYTYLFGFEESYGYLAGTYARDKDAVVASMLITEMAAYYMSKGMTLYDAMQHLYKKYGFYAENVSSVTMEGLDGLQRMKDIMNKLRKKSDISFGNSKCVSIADYSTSEEKNILTGQSSVITLPKSDVLQYKLDDNSVVIIRPSGTEPKIKTYIMVNGKSSEECSAKSEKIKNTVKTLLS